MKFRENAKSRCNNLYADLFDGYIIPEGLLSSDKDVKEVNQAVSKIREFLDRAVEEGAIEFCEEMDDDTKYYSCRMADEDIETCRFEAGEHIFENF